MGIHKVERIYEIEETSIELTSEIGVFAKPICLPSWADCKACCTCTEAGADCNKCSPDKYVKCRNVFNDMGCKCPKSVAVAAQEVILDELVSFSHATESSQYLLGGNIGILAYANVCDTDSQLIKPCESCCTCGPRGGLPICSLSGCGAGIDICKQAIAKGTCSCQEIDSPDQGSTFTDTEKSDITKVILNYIAASPLGYKPYIVKITSTSIEGATGKKHVLYGMYDGSGERIGGLDFSANLDH
ncbi:hypothetical protein FH972_024446 [Carpinus fangiana]|uniref:Uncharacterized protein n=1 Tax=Carpinus fangiana TaxID=176857 RepID=A0A5N6KYF5_9ROSI|nr:hypothetical protein FH972_024446 [Carpinus fangiana]